MAGKQRFLMTVNSDVSHSPAIQQERMAEKIEPQPTHKNEIANEIVQDFGFGL
jgi:hypothetical protein